MIITKEHGFLSALVDVVVGGGGGRGNTSSGPNSDDDRKNWTDGTQG